MQAQRYLGVLDSNDSWNFAQKKHAVKVRHKAWCVHVCVCVCLRYICGGEALVLGTEMAFAS
jgi:hypothetical protein